MIESRSGLPPRGGVTLLLSIWTLAVAMLPAFLTGSLYPLIARDIHLPPDKLGLVIAIFFAASAAGSAGLAPLADKQAPWTVARVSLVAVLAALLGLAWANSTAIMYVCMVVAGVANGCIQPAINVAISRHIAQARQGLAFGFKQSAIPLATLLGGFAVPVVGLTLGWRAGYFLAAVAVAGLLLFLPRQSHGQARPKPVADSGMLLRFLIMVSALAGLGAGSANAMAAFIVGYGVSSGIDLAKAGFVVALGSAASIAIRILLGLAADRFALPLFLGVAICLGGGAFAYVLLALGGPLSVYVLAVLLSFGMGWGWAGISLLGVVRASGPRAGHVTGVMQSGLFTGAVAGPLGFGWLASSYSYGAAWTALAIAATIAALLGLGLQMLTPKAAAPAAVANPATPPSK